MFTNVVVGVDHHGGRDAIALARQLAADDARVTLCHVYTGDPCVYRGVSVAYEESEREEDLRFLAQARAQAGMDADLHWLRAPSAAAGLHKVCAELRADLLVVGASRREGLDRTLHGDDAQGALHRAPCIVAIAPAGYADEPHAIQEIGVGEAGAPSEELAQCSAGIDLLVVGPDGDGRIGRHHHDHTARSLARTSRCPLLVVPEVHLDILVSATPAGARTPRSPADGARDVAADAPGHEPWEGYARMTANEVILRLEIATPQEIAGAALYESAHRRRPNILAAAERRWRRVGAGIGVH